MKRILIAVLAAVLLMTTSSSIAAAPAKIQIALSMSPDKTLPGLAVPLSLRVRNGGRAVELGRGIRVRATSPSGESFIASWGEGNDSGVLEFGPLDDDRFILPANTTADLEVPALDLSQLSWALDARLLAVPGQWTLQALLYVGDLDSRDDRLEAVASNPARLTIETPTGGDVPIWEAIQRGEARSISDSVLAERPESRYFPYLSTVIARYASLDKVAIISRAIELHPGSPVVPRLHEAVANYYRMEADRVWDTEGDFEKAVSLAEKGRSVLKSIESRRDTWSKRMAARKLCCEYVGREYFVELRRLKEERATPKR